MTKDHADVPYYDSGISGTHTRIYDQSMALLKEHSTLAQKYIDNAPVTVKEVYWDMPDIGKSYKISQLAENFIPTYGDHIMLTAYDYIDDEVEEVIHIFNKRLSQTGHTEITHAKKVIRLTTQHQKERDEWWETNKKKTSNGNAWVAFGPDNTDEIANKLAMLEHFISQAEMFIKK